MYSIYVQPLLDFICSWNLGVKNWAAPFTLMVVDTLAAGAYLCMSSSGRALRTGTSKVYCGTARISPWRFTRIPLTKFFSGREICWSNMLTVNICEIMLIFGPWKQLWNRKKNLSTGAAVSVAPVVSSGIQWLQQQWLHLLQWVRLSSCALRGIGKPCGII